VDFIKVNFDGASKGNLGEAGFGMVFSKPSGEYSSHYHRNLGHTTNNVENYGGSQEGYN
jgi:ribonuclease HI